MKNLETFLLKARKGNFISRFIGDRRAKKLAKERRKEAAVLKWKCSIAGETNWVNKGFSTKSHRWDLWESDDGRRKVEFVNGNKDHPMWAIFIGPWLAKKIDLDYESWRKGELSE